jgi:hypothetical protein
VVSNSTLAMAGFCEDKVGVVFSYKGVTCSALDKATVGFTVQELEWGDCFREGAMRSAIA